MARTARVAALVVATGLVAVTTWSLWLADGQEAGHIKSLGFLTSEAWVLKPPLFFGNHFGSNFQLAVGVLKKTWRTSCWRKSSRNFADGFSTLLEMWQPSPRPYRTRLFWLSNNEGLFIDLWRMLAYPTRDGPKIISNIHCDALQDVRAQLESQGVHVDDEQLSTLAKRPEKSCDSVIIRALRKGACCGMTGAQTSWVWRFNGRICNQNDQNVLSQ